MRILLYRFTFLAILAALLTQMGCASTSAYDAKVRSWEGKDAQSLVRAWGQPDAMEKLSSGNKMWVYSRLHHEAYAYNEPRNELQRQVASTNGQPVHMYIKCATYFEVNPNNIIVTTLFRGDECKL